MVDPSNLTCGNLNAPPAPACGQPWQKVVANVGNASSRGLEVQMDIAASENLSLNVNAMFLDAVLDEDIPDIGVLAGARLPCLPSSCTLLKCLPFWQDNVKIVRRSTSPYCLAPRVEFEISQISALCLVCLGNLQVITS